MASFKNFLQPADADEARSLATFSYLTTITDKQSHNSYCHDGVGDTTTPPYAAVSCAGEIRAKGVQELNRMYGTSVDDLTAAFQESEHAEKTSLRRRLSSRARSAGGAPSSDGQSIDGKDAVDTSKHSAFETFAFAAHLASIRQNSQSKYSRDLAQTWLKHTGTLFDACVHAYHDEGTDEQERRSYVTQLHAQIKAFKAIAESSNVTLSQDGEQEVDQLPSPAQLQAQGIDPDIEQLGQFLD